MKKSIKFMITMVFIVVSIMFVGCNPNQSDNNTEIPTKAQEFKSNVYTVKPYASGIEDGIPKVLDFHTDGKKNYYLLDGGYLERVYINTIAMIDYTGVPVTLSKTRTTQEQISRSLTTAISESYAVSISEGVKSTLSAKFGFNANKMKCSLGASEEFSWNISSSAEYGKSVTNSSTVIQEFSESQTITAVLEKGEPIGCYRYAIYGVVDVYICCVTSLDNQELYLFEICACTRENEMLLRPEYSEDGRFNNSPETNINLKEDFYKKLPLSDSGDDEFMVKKEIYNTNINGMSFIEVTDAGYFGLQNRGMDEIDLSEFKNYFDKDHLFCFELEINISLKDEGYQEVYLYNSNKTTSKSLKLTNAVSDYGLVRGIVYSRDDKPARDHYIYWYVRGDEVREKMYVRYDACGNNSDTWYRNSLVVKLAVSSQYDELPKECVVAENQKEIKVTDSGDFGLAPREVDTLNIPEAFLKYRNKSYVYSFDVNINLHEIDDGYQEIFLYNKTVGPTKNGKSYKEAQELGLIFGQQFEHDSSGKNASPKDYSVIWNVGGDIMENCNQLYIRYQASGNSSDDWIKNSIKVKMKVFKVPERMHESEGDDVTSLMYSIY